MSDSQTRNVLISDAQFKHFRALCGNRFNWTDGGYWNGPGKKPNCFLKQSFSKKSRIIVRWPTEDSAKRWNDDWAQAQRNMGYAGTGLTTLAFWYGNIGKTLGIALFSNIAADIFKGELIANIPHPQAKAGWQMVTELAFRYQRSVHPLNPTDSMRVTKTVLMIDDKNQEHVYSKPQTTKLVVQGDHMEELVLRVFGEPGSETSYDY